MTVTAQVENYGLNLDLNLKAATGEVVMDRTAVITFVEDPQRLPIECLARERTISWITNTIWRLCCASWYGLWYEAYQATYRKTGLWGIKWSHSLSPVQA